MLDFKLWFTEGLWHIADIRAYDHILFLIVLFCGFELKEWKRVILLLTAFTIGHSTSLALSVLSLVKIGIGLVEFLIPCTILFTSLYNILTLKRATKTNLALHFMLALFFGLIHGLGFSVLLRSLLGRANNLVGPLFSFNLGIEAGQLLIMAVVFLVTAVFTKIIKASSYSWRFFLSAAAFGISLIMALERL